MFIFFITYIYDSILFKRVTQIQVKSVTFLMVFTSKKLKE